MVVWALLPISLSLVSFIGTWTVYGLAFKNNHVCSLSDWHSPVYNCRQNSSVGCCGVPTISTSGSNAPENSLFSATISLGAFLFLLFSISHHAHILERNAAHAMLSRFALAFGVVASIGSFVAGNSNPVYLSLLHNLGATLSFTCFCFYTTLLTVLTGKCVLTGWERWLYLLRVVSTIIQIVVTICSTVLFAQDEYLYKHISAVFEWMLSVNLELFELSYSVEFCAFTSAMLANLLGRQSEDKLLILNPQPMGNVLT